MPVADGDPLASCLRAVTEALPPSTPPYCLIGALAVNAWGRVRTTRDVDLLVFSQDPDRTELIDRLLARGFQRDRTWSERNPLAKESILRLTHPSYPGLPLDLLFAADAHGASTLSRRRPLAILGLTLWVCSPEDLILLKLKASRPHDFEDALGIATNPHLQLDRDYLWSWADQLGLQGELHYVLHAAASGRETIGDH